jgi:signal transduction histidine kinase
MLGATLLLVPSAAHGTGGDFLLLVSAAWMLVAHNPPARAAAGLPALGLALLPHARSAAQLLPVAVVLLGAVVTATVYRRDRGATATLHSRVEELERTRASSLRAAAAAERGHIARELHDIVAHSVSVMTVQAAAARLQLGRDPAQAIASLSAVEGAVDTALAELDRLLDLLGEGGELCGLADVERLTERMQAAGLDVRLRVEGQPRALHGGVDLALYRVLQEALTNARKHAGTVAVEVRICHESEQVRLRVVSELPHGAPAQGVPAQGVSESRGQGLIGMQERIAMYDGELDAGVHDRSFVIDARVPTP